MSTKIHKGFLLHSASIDEGYETIDEVRTLVLINQAKLCADFIKEHMRRFDVDRIEATRVLLDRWDRIQSQKIRDPAVDTEFKVVLFPGAAFGFLGIAFTEQGDWFQQWLEHENISEFGYWDNAEPPTGVSEKAWQHREREWEKVLPDSSIPAMQGFTIDIGDPRSPILYMDRIKEHLK